MTVKGLKSISINQVYFLWTPPPHHGMCPLPHFYSSQTPPHPPETKCLHEEMSVVVHRAQVISFRVLEPAHLEPVATEIVIAGEEPERKSEREGEKGKR
ncbi:hypothetical protein J6590_061678 [Homalodisca vitripennis]|nr:hypothetical protein J6590_061678 [Homalodisca vitripennis]